MANKITKIAIATAATVATVATPAIAMADETTTTGDQAS